MNSTSSVACMSCGSEMVASCGERNVLMRDCVVDSNKERRMRGVNGYDVVEDSVCTITKSNNTVNTNGLGSLSATPLPGGGGGAHVGLKTPASIVELILAA